MREASYYEIAADSIKCLLCPKKCSISEGQTGFCRVRKNVGGVLYTKNYDLCSSCAVDPIEKKPLYHFYPGANVFSIGTWGCNFNCSFCQNWSIAQHTPRLVELSSEQAVALALEQHSSIGMAYTYSEPSVWFEYVLETEKLANMQGLKNIVVTNGYINPEPLAQLIEYTDAFNIDLKAFNDKFYGQICGGTLEPILNNIQKAAEKCHVEITTLLITGLNDSKDEISSLADWLAKINVNIPLHLTRYFPNNQLTVPPTPLETMQQAYEIASQYLNYVYIGNVTDAQGANTYCPNCKAIVIDRGQWHSHLTKDNHCVYCGSAVKIVGEVSI